MNNIQLYIKQNLSTGKNNICTTKIHIIYYVVYVKRILEYIFNWILPRSRELNKLVKDAVCINTNVNDQKKMRIIILFAIIILVAFNNITFKNSITIILFQIN